MPLIDVVWFLESRLPFLSLIDNFFLIQYDFITTFAFEGNVIRKNDSAWVGNAQKIVMALWGQDSAAKGQVSPRPRFC